MTKSKEQIKDHRLYPNRPHIGVGAIVWDSENILLIKRAKPPKQGEWSIPGGMQKVGETLIEAVSREIKEETGLDISNPKLLDVIDMILKDDEGHIERHYTLIDFVADAVNISSLKAGSDALDAQFFHWQTAMDTVHWPETQKIISLAAKDRGVL